MLRLRHDQVLLLQAHFIYFLSIFSANVLKNDVLRQKKPDFSYTVVQSLTDFSFDMLGNVTESLARDDNVVLSPLSLFSVFSMLLEGKITYPVQCLCYATVLS